MLEEWSITVAGVKASCQCQGCLPRPRPQPPRQNRPPSGLKHTSRQQAAFCCKQQHNIWAQIIFCLLHTFPRSSRSASKVKIYQPKHDGEWKVFPVTKELVFDWLWKMTKMTYCEIKACALFITECMCDKMTGVMLKWLFCCDDVRVCRTEVIPAAGEAAAHRMTILASLH